MLKGIPKILSPELLKVLCEMGHSDRLVIADGNFPAESMGKDAIVIRMDGHGTSEILEAAAVPAGYLCRASGESHAGYARRCGRDTDLGGIQQNRPAEG